MATDSENAVVGHHLWPWTSGLCWTARAVYVTSPNDGHTAQQRLVVPEPSTITRCDSRRGFGALAQLRSGPVQAGSACLTDFGLIAAASRSVGLADAVVWGWSSACQSAKMTVLEGSRDVVVGRLCDKSLNSNSDHRRCCASLEWLVLFVVRSERRLSMSGPIAE